MKIKHIFAHMKAAHTYADLSYCERLKVGCIIVKDDKVISIGYNGTPPGWENVCECENGISKPEVLHAEANAISKLASSNESCNGAVIFCTAAPCVECAKLIVQSKAKEVYFGTFYKNTDGLDFLNKSGIPTVNISIPRDYYQPITLGQKIGFYIDKLISKINLSMQ